MKNIKHRKHMKYIRKWQKGDYLIPRYDDEFLTSGNVIFLDFVDDVYFIGKSSNESACLDDFSLEDEYEVNKHCYIYYRNISHELRSMKNEIIRLNKIITMDGIFENCYDDE